MNYSGKIYMIQEPGSLTLCLLEDGKFITQLGVEYKGNTDNRRLVSDNELERRAFHEIVDDEPQGYTHYIIREYELANTRTR